MIQIKRYINKLNLADSTKKKKLTFFNFNFL